MKIAQNIEHSYAQLDVSAAVLRCSYQRNKMTALGYLNTQGRQTSLLALALYLSGCHRHSDICPSHLYASPRTRLGFVGALCWALGAHKNSVGRRRILIMKRANGVQAAYDAFLLRVLQVTFGCAAIFNTSKEARSSHFHWEHS